MECRRQFVRSAGLALHCTEWGPPQGRPVLMLHGIRGYAQTFEVVAAALQPRWRVIAFDQRGRGDSDWDPAGGYYTDHYVADVHAVVEALGLERFDLLGHSMGGINAIVYASTHPQHVRRLVVEDAGPGAFEHSPGAQRIRRELENTPPGFANWDEAAQYMRALRPTVTEQARQQRLHSMLKPDGRGGLTWRHDHDGIARARLNPEPGRVVDLGPHVAALACQTLVLRGGRSDYLQPEMAEAMARANPRIRWQTIADAGHYIHDDQPERFNAAVAAFLEAD